MVAFLARRYADVVEVQRADDGPADFVWRGRHYTVCRTLAHWIRTGPWWEQAAPARMITGDPPPQPSGVPGEADQLTLAALPPSPRWGQRAWGEPAPDVGIVVDPATIDDDEREFWRVEATTGRSRIPAVVELCFAWSTATWTVASVMD